jgi:hypothetical protein
MGHWIKHFYDGSKYIGEDEEIEKGRASWRNSPNEGIVCVELREGTEVYLGIGGRGEFWQADLCEAAFPSGKVVVIARSIQKKIGSGDAFVCVERDGFQVTAEVYSTLPTTRREMFPIQGYMIGKWLTLTYDFEKGVNLSIQDDRL